MSLVKTLLLACALAVPVTMAHVATSDVTAQAAGKKAKKAKVAAGKSCGEYKYLKGGKCQDARSKKSSDS